MKEQEQEIHKEKREGKDLENYQKAYRNSREFRMLVLKNRFGKKLKMSL